MRSRLATRMFIRNQIDMLVNELYLLVCLKVTYSTFAELDSISYRTLIKLSRQIFQKLLD